MLHLLFLLPTEEFSDEQMYLEELITDVNAKTYLLEDKKEKLKIGFSVIKYFHSKVYIPLKIKKYERIKDKLIEES